MNFEDIKLNTLYQHFITHIGSCCFIARQKDEYCHGIYIAINEINEIITISTNGKFINKNDDPNSFNAITEIKTTEKHKLIQQLFTYTINVA